MVIQEPLTKRLAYRSLIYAMLGDKTQSEALARNDEPTESSKSGFKMSVRERRF